MITDKQVEAVIRAYHGNMAIPDRTMPELIQNMRKALESVEQSKPKPEPYRYISENTGECVLPHELPEDLKISGRWKPLYTTPPTQAHYQEPFGYFKAEPFGWTDCDKDDDGAIALYEAPPTREPLSDATLDKLLWGLDSDVTLRQFKVTARAVEQAHGIGVTND